MRNWELRDFFRRCAEDFEFFAFHCLKIRVKRVPDGADALSARTAPVRLEPFVLNAEQKVVLAWVMHQIRLRKPVRIIIDKCRKLGMSTLSQGIAFWLCQFIPLYRATVVAQSAEDTAVVQTIARTFMNNLPPMLAPVGPRTTGPFLVWPHGDGKEESWFRGITQGANAGGRGDDPLFFHLSEVAFWEEGRATSDAEVPITSYIGSLDDLPLTFVIIESTANGQSGAFYDRWRAAEGAWGNPEIHDELKSWRPFFFSWQGVPKYSRRVPDDVDAAHAAMLLTAKTDRTRAGRLWDRLPYARLFKEHSAEFFQLAVDHGLTAAECAWAADRLAAFGGKVDAFHQEFPLTWQMSFLASGNPVLDQRIINRWMAAPSRVMRSGAELREEGNRIVLDEYGADWQFFGTATDEARPLDLEATWDPHRPDARDDQFIIATDSAAGTGDGDHAALRVFSRKYQRVVAELYSKSVPPDRLGQQAVLAARFWNNAYVIPEANNHGWATINAIVNDMRYHNVHRQNPGVVPQAGTPWTAVWGWRTDKKSKQMMLDEVSKRVRLEMYDEPSKRFCDEAKGFVVNQYGRAVTMHNCHDDLIDTTALLFLADNQLPSMSAATLTTSSGEAASFLDARLAKARASAKKPMARRTKRRAGGWR